MSLSQDTRPVSRSPGSNFIDFCQKSPAADKGCLQQGDFLHFDSYLVNQTWGRICFSMKAGDFGR